MEIPYTVKPRPDTGLYNAKLGIWLFLASEVMLFGALFSSYVLLRVGASEGTWSMGLMDIFVGAGNTMVLIASSMFVVLAWAQLKQGNLSGKWISRPLKNSFSSWGYIQWKWATVICAIFFLIVKWAYEWPSKFKHYDVWFNSPASLHAVVNQGYKEVALNETKRADTDKVISEHIDAKSYFEKKIYTKRFFKSSSDLSIASFKSQWDDGTLAISGYITGHEEAIINVDVSEWNNESGTTKPSALELLESYELESPSDILSSGGNILKDIDYNTAKLAEYKLSKNGFKVELSVTGYESIVGKPYFWRTHRINESIGGKPRVKTLTFELDKSKASYDGVYKYKQVKIDTSDVKRLSSYEPKHSTFFGIYYTITSLHALHVFGGILVMIYNLLPIGLATWYKDREQFANRIESYGLFWHFVDLVWIFLFPILYIL